MSQLRSSNLRSNSSLSYLIYRKDLATTSLRIHLRRKMIPPTLFRWFSYCPTKMLVTSWCQCSFNRFKQASKITNNSWMDLFPKIKSCFKTTWSKASCNKRTHKLVPIRDLLLKLNLNKSKQFLWKTLNNKITKSKTLSSISRFTTFWITPRIWTVLDVIWVL